MQKVDAVVVTFNRLKKLQHALECYDKQSVPFRSLIVVDNHSTDGTIEYLKEWEMQSAAYEKHVIYLPSNVGGSGGFYEGEKYAIEHGADWVYISDDDAYPEILLVEKFNTFCEQHKEEKISAICATVTFVNGKIINGCRRHMYLKDGYLYADPSTDDEYRLSSFKHNVLSYVGVFLSGAAMKQEGLVDPTFFIYQDDSEHSIRLSKYGTMYCLPNMRVIHDTDLINATPEHLERMAWKEYYGARNGVYIVIKHFPSIKDQTIDQYMSQIKVRRESSLTAIKKMYLQGIKDAIDGKMGIHEIYRPGMNVPLEKMPYPWLFWKRYYWKLRLLNMLRRIGIFAKK